MFNTTVFMIDTIVATIATIVIMMYAVKSRIKFNKILLIILCYIGYLIFGYGLVDFLHELIAYYMGINMNGRVTKYSEIFDFVYLLWIAVPGVCVAYRYIENISYTNSDT